MKDSQQKFRFSIDRGGTFTDVYAEVPGEEGFRVVKLLSEDPQNYPDAPREGIRRILEEVSGKTIPEEGIDADLIDWIRMGTTVATNALLERKGVRTVLVTTAGFQDLLKIGNQSRPRIFDLEIKKPELLYESVIEVDERVRLLGKKEDPAGKRVVEGSTGEKLLVLRGPDAEKVRQQLSAVYQSGIRSIAVVFIHAYTFHEHENQIGKIAKELGFEQISLSHQVMPMVKMVPRGDTTSVDAYLTPHIQQYLNSFRSGFTNQLEQSLLLFMQSDGGLVNADHFKGSNAILSGPAGGVVGYACTTDQQESGQPMIGFDMGGTSTDVSRFGGEYELVHETETAGVRIQAPQMHIKTVAAGGGSRLFFRNGMFEAGPESAGAHPGPLCYRKNGHLAITDANLFLGRLHVDFFPKIFGITEDQALDFEASRLAFEKLTEEINAQYAIKGRSPLSPEEVALGFLEVANEVMVRPIREISVMRGYDIKEHVLACFGGAGGQHACAIARELGISKIFIHRFAGVLSAYGMGLADVVVEKQEPSAKEYRYESYQQHEKKRIEFLSGKAVAALVAEGYDAEQIELQCYLNLRYQGTDTAMMIQQPDDDDFERVFRESYRREFGFDLTDRSIMIDDIRVRAVAKSPVLKKFRIGKKEGKPLPETITRCYFKNGWQETPIYQLETLGQGQTISGPAMLIQNTSTILIEPDCRAEITEFGDVSIDVVSDLKKEISTQVDPIQLSIFSNLFMSIAEQMGRTLERTSISTNIKERLDFSCAIFDPEGGLVANAPHQPVHLGAMSEAIRQQMKIQGKNLKEGDVLVTNHPIAGGSHLPDITVITPVWKQGEIIFFVADRGHHAEIGGISPGSMPPFSRILEEEGACIKSFKLVENGAFNEDGVRELLMAPAQIKRASDQSQISGTRRISDNISDLKAQVAANQRGVELLLEMIDHYSLDVVQAYMRHIQVNAEEAVRRMFQELSQSWGLAEVDTVHAEDHLDDGSLLVLNLTINRQNGSAIFDFKGTGPEIWGNLNAPRAVTYSAIIYSLRCLIQKEIPLNQGCLNPIEIIIEEGSLLAPSEQAAVVGGNVLTSQRITDVVLRAFKAAAASQGCMNNFTFGNDKFGYYETVGGGAGAGPRWHGQSGVHTHMTNTRITDPEILERRYPVVLREFSLRKESGGQGKFAGGDGLVREVEFLEPLNVAILSERRTYAPYGMAGGEPGKCGQNHFFRKNGRVLNLGGKNEIQADPGDRIRIMTPGGGGFGKV
ncbi:MAG: hydantoinase B/oxoprolinase family protein [SAR324 cluster bacterium]|nr:hydantoinase B/oxoprolinase family protein [SAR324 cluster bacterium]